MSKGNKRITQRDVRLLDETLKNKENEKDVENAWRTIFRKYFVENNDKESSPEMNSPYNVDGLITTHELIPTKLLMEFKDGTDLNKDYDRSRIMAQCIHYMHIFKEQGESLPNVIVGADENQAFVLYAPNFYHYVDDNKYNWDTRPSDAYRNDTKLMDDLTKDPNMKVWTYDFLEKGITLKQEYLNIKNMFDEIDSYTKLQGDNFKVSVTDKNINGLFLQFEKIVLKNSTKVNPVDAVNAFMKLLLVEDQDEYYQNPGNHNKLHLPNDKSIDINGSEFQIFFKRYDRNFSPNEKDRLKDMVDRLIKDDERRKSGDFWTPTIWADQADKVLQKSFGNNYKNEALIWDCAAGDKNLTRDFSYDMLFSSTIHQGEVNLSSHRNPEAISFRYDFLNDDVDKNPTDNPDPSNWKMPNRLYNNLIDASRTGKNVIFYTNPPFATENSNKRTNGKSKSSNSKNNKIVSFMKEHNLGGAATQQLFSQFLGRILKLIDDFDLKRAGIGFFMPATFFTGGKGWHLFNKKFFEEFKVDRGIVFKSDEFSDTSGNWPIVFVTLKLQKNNIEIQDMTNNFKVEETNYDDKSGTYNVINKDNLKKTMRMVFPPDLLENSWASFDNSLSNFVSNYPSLTSAMKITSGKSSGKLKQNSLGYLQFKGSRISENRSGVWLASSLISNGHGFNVIEENFDKTIVMFSARRAIDRNWLNDRDNYQIPNVEKNGYQEFVNDSLVFSLFDSQSKQAAYRNGGFSNLKNFQCKWANQWFWVDINTVKEEANRQNQDVIFNDVNGDKNRFVTTQLKKRELSPTARKVLDQATNVWRKSLRLRTLALSADDSMSYDAWDAGWFQIKQLIKNYGGPGIVFRFKEFRHFI